MKTLLLIVAALAAVHVPGPARAIDPGVATGTLEVGGTTIPLTHAYARLHRNADKRGGGPQELRLLLADRETPQSALDGIADLPATQLARDGKLRGLLVRLDPDDPKRALITVLDAPADPSRSLVTRKVSGGKNMVRDLRIANNRVWGALESSDSRAELPKIDYSVKFSAPLFTGPASTADSKGKAARDHPQTGALRDDAHAISPR